MSCSSRVVYEQAFVEIDAGAVNINTASVSEIEKLPGVGTKTAEAIVEYRELEGAFRCVEHLMLIRGVSERKFTELKPMLRAE